MWRPKSWRNPYLWRLKEGTEDEYIKGSAKDEVDEAYEEGADAMLRALVEEFLGFMIALGFKEEKGD